MKLQIKIKSVYGVERIYPANDVAERMTKLIGQKTFTKEHLILIAGLGFIIEQIHAYQLNTKEVS